MNNVSIDTPKTWFTCDLPELKDFIENADNAVTSESDLVKKLDSIGAHDTANDMRGSISKGNQAKINDMRKCFAHRVKQEKPDPVTLWPGDDKEAIRARISGMQTHNYEMDQVAEQYGLLSEE